MSAMIDGARKLPPHHLTVRVPWHDNGWKGTVCNNPCGNTSCTVLKGIAVGRDDAWETRNAGKKLNDPALGALPPCVTENAAVMAPFELELVRSHPYASWATETHGHFQDTPYTIRSYSVAAIPYRWVLRKHVEGDEQGSVQGKRDLWQFGYEAEREPADDRTKTWIQEGTNQRIILDTFFSAAVPEQSLVFFYAKRTPLTEDSQRVLIGVGRVKSVGDPVEYRYADGAPPPGKTRGYLWERNVEHSIRPDGTDGFLLPYDRLLEVADEDENLDITSCIAFAPSECWEEYSYGSELLPHDGAIASLLALQKAIEGMSSLSLDAPWEKYLGWLDTELSRLWRARGAFPGLGAALHAFGLPYANLLAWRLVGDGGEAMDPWPRLSSVLGDPSSLPGYLRERLGPTLRAKWQALPDKRRALLMLLARCNLTNEQAFRWYDETKRTQQKIQVSDEAILENPYRIYEDDRWQQDPVAFTLVDRGLFPPPELRQEFPVPEPSRVGEDIDPRRVRAAMVQTLEDAAVQGHTILPADWLIERVRGCPIEPGCPLDADTLPVIDDALSPLVVKAGDTSAKEGAFQLDRYQQASQLISDVVKKRQSGRSNPGESDWMDLVNQAVDSEEQGTDAHDDQRARKEKAAALREIYRARVSVLVGSAGTGKSTLVKALCKIPTVQEGGVLLLAPTGKARVRLEQASEMPGQGKTIAQFLLGLNRYDAGTGRYYVNEVAPRSSAHKTIVIDECSMLTEDQLAATLDAVRGAERLILVGDPRQLPPIGAGRPYVDIVEQLKPDNIGNNFPRVVPGSGYAELTVTMRQQTESVGARRDVLLANAFSGYPQDAGADEIWHSLGADPAAPIKLVRWDQPGELQEVLQEELVAELGLGRGDEEVMFEISIGGVASEYNGRTNVFFNTAYKNWPGAAEKAEDWQILSPFRHSLMGVLALNRAIQQRFRKKFITRAQNGKGQTILKPAGPEGIIYGDKVINVINNGGRDVWPKKADRYVANGDIGIVTGHLRTKRRDWKPNEIEVELVAQPGHSYKYYPSELNAPENTPPLELAYALTAHKAQGSEFGTVFLIIPNPCRVLSREMLYTALTRHTGKVVILHQGDFRELQRYAQADASDVAKRMTNLFQASRPRRVQLKKHSVFLDENLIYVTERGELVRSKSEWIIADKLHAAGIDYQYEQPLKLGNVERFPDFTIVDDDRGVAWYWEHNGLMDNIEYRNRWERKLAAYREAGILPLDEGGGENGALLVTEEKQGVGLDAAAIQRNIDAILVRG